MHEGSPPRVRGTVDQPRHMGGNPRITPACAGNSPRWVYAGATGWDHPRVCGEQIAKHKNIPIALGSPPRVRGTASQAGPFVVR